MRQMYKIYINESPLLFCSTEELKNLNPGKQDLSFYYNGNRKRLHNVIDMMEKGNSFDRIIIFSDNIQGIWKDFKAITKIIKAGGGIVFNQFGELLVIFRRGFWDLPKGKIEKNEKKKDGAIREVMEECGVRDLKLIRKIDKTHHIYRQNYNKILKKSIWYLMECPKQELTPQLEEGIEEAIWVDPTEFLSSYSMYNNIRAILTKYMEDSMIKLEVEDVEI